ncbi:hypothetical protein [Desulfosarcina ovata]|uniref:hypothetical protein n=1 Tax=Desulfosarcina ovata TaxID=83564 RepID=UPI0012D32651|nr:hypothetical protein [Desulfosarcina ovata]
MNKLQAQNATAYSYSDIYDFKRKDIDEYIKINGIPNECYKKSPSLKDGYYLVSDDKKWSVYYQERNIKFNEKNFKKEQKAIDYLVSLLLRASCTGIDF